MGAELLSTHLQGVPQYDLFESRYTWKDQFWTSEYSAKLAALGSISVLRVSYWRGWSISVHAVPRQHSATARELLSLNALPALAASLNRAEVEPESYGWEALYDLAAARVRIVA